MSETEGTQESPTTSNENPLPVNEEIENLFKDTPLSDSVTSFDTPESDEGDAALKIGTNVLKSLVVTLQKLSHFAARKTGLQSVELTDEDVEELTDALEPFAKEILKYIEILPYLPLIMFAVAYGIRILAELDDRKKRGKDEAALRVAVAKAKMVEQRQKKVDAQKEMEKEELPENDKNKTTG